MESAEAMPKLTLLAAAVGLSISHFQRTFKLHTGVTPKAYAKALQDATAPAFEKIGLKLEAVTVQNVSLPEELQKILDQKIGMGMVGNDMGKFMQYQTAQSLPEFAKGAAGGGVVGDAMGLGAGVALGQVMAQQLNQGLQGGAQAASGMKPDEVMATLEKLADLKAKGILTDDEFAAKKADLLKKLG